MILYYDLRCEPLRFAVADLLRSLEGQGVRAWEASIADWAYDLQDPAVIIQIGNRDPLMHPRVPMATTSAGPEGFSIHLSGACVHVVGADAAGTMYGILDLAETIRLHGISSIANTTHTPSIPVRGVKFNLPHAPYDDGEPFIQNRAVCLTQEFWADYIDFLTMHRYNLLTLWSADPFSIMSFPPAYAQATDFSPEEQRNLVELWTFVFHHARQRGIRVWIITWNIRISRRAALSLGLPEHLGDPENEYAFLTDRFTGTGSLAERSYSIRQHQQVVKEYYRELIRTLLMTYPELDGLGTNPAEAMTGSVSDRMAWIREVYLEAVQDSGRDISLLVRTNMGTAKAALEQVLNDHTGPTYIDFKYSNAHMYSHAHPQFESMWSVWDDADLGSTRIVYTLRNDDAHTFRFGDPQFIRQYLQGMMQPGKPIAGYMWGSDGYVWGVDFQHVTHRHGPQVMDYQRNWYQFALLGRVGYDLDFSDTDCIAMLAYAYGKELGQLYFSGFQAAARILCAVNRLFWINYDYEWHAESLLSIYGFKNIVDIVWSNPMPGVNVLRIADFIPGQKYDPAVETPADIIDEIEGQTALLRRAIEELEGRLTEGMKKSVQGCALADLQAWSCLGTYHTLRFSAAIDIHGFIRSGDEQLKSDAVNRLREACSVWEALSIIWSSHYLPYMMTRSKQLFSYGAYREEVQNDAKIVERLSRQDWGRVGLGKAAGDPDPGQRVY